MGAAEPRLSWPHAASVCTSRALKAHSARSAPNALADPSRSNTGSDTTERTAALAHVESQLGTHDLYLAADGGKFPPLGIARFPFRAAGRIYTTMGMGSFPMPHAAADGGAPHVEVAVAAEREVPWAAQVLAWLGRYPWMQYV